LVGSQGAQPDAPLTGDTPVVGWAAAGRKEGSRAGSGDADAVNGVIPTGTVSVSKWLAREQKSGNRWASGDSWFGPQNLVRS